MNQKRLFAKFDSWAHSPLKIHLFQELEEKLDDWEFAVIDLFLNAANSFGLPKSYGQIYGLLFCRDVPLSMDEVMNLLEISKGSASQGLRALRNLGAILLLSQEEIGKNDFLLKSACGNWLVVFFAEQADPHLEKGIARLQQIEALIKEAYSGDSSTRAIRRHEILSSWHRQMSRLLPWVKMIVGKSDRLPKKNKN